MAPGRAVGTPLMWVGWGLGLPLWAAATVTAGVALAVLELARRGSRRYVDRRRTGR